MTERIMTLNDEQRAKLAAWKAQHAHEPKFQEFLGKVKETHQVLCEYYDLVERAQRK